LYITNYMEETALTKIANKYHCDKGTEAYEKHGYTEEYAKYIPLTGKYSLLEIGIWHGDSLKMWREYNPDLDLHAIDIDANCLRYIGDFKNIYIGNQSDHEFLSTVVKGKEFDFIIDDGSHYMNDILNSLYYLYDYLKPGGYYFIEDIHAGQAQKEKLIESLISYFHDKPSRKMSMICNDKLILIIK